MHKSDKTCAMRIRIFDVKQVMRQKRLGSREDETLKSNLWDLQAKLSHFCETVYFDGFSVQR